VSRTAISGNEAEHIIAALSAQGVVARALSADSRALRAGEVFVAYPGHRTDGRRYIADALRAGAGAVLWEREGYVWDEAWSAPNLAVDGLQPLSGHIAHLVYGRPSERLSLIGVTGTNGKTSVSQWIAQALGRLGRKCGVIGTLGNGFPGALTESANTTPDGIALHAQLARFAEQGAQAAAMEVSSIGLEQGRANGAHFSTSVFTNLTRDHLDYHASMEAYAAAKARLFDLPGIRAHVLNLDDAFGCVQAERLIARGDRVIGYTQQQAGDFGLSGVDTLLRAAAIDVRGQGMCFELHCAGQRLPVQAPVVGQFNVSNLLAVIGGLLANDVALEQACAAIAQIEPPPGRMQALGGETTPLVVIDYAHSPDALEKVLAALRPAAQARSGRLVCVFGCGGDRDPGKRPLMGAVASRLADEVVLTSDNPRSEGPMAIIEAVAAGVHGSYSIEVERAAAIAGVVSRAADADVVLIAGKGHESYQEVRGVRYPFSDVEQAQAALDARAGEWRGKGQSS
jgi:UDP-N-acetylmuramoyl-L-alanyl-D-glutamate--2,6-diaminopimelate ligase